MQFAYQFPERAERLVLVASGGLGKEVSPLLKAVTLPGAEYVLPLLLHPRIREVAEWPGAVAGRVGWRPSDSLAEVWRSYTTLTDRHGQMAFVHTVRSVIDVAGQRVSAHDRLYLAEAVPTLIVWGDCDRIIPVAHAYRAAEAIPGAKKLLKLTVDIGTEVRQVCAGIAEYYEPEKLIGMKVVIVTNLQPRKLRGVESNGMIVAASIGETGRPVLVTFNEDVPNGAKLR